MATTSSGGSDRGGEGSALLTLVDGLIERAQRSPLMRRAPAQCTPEEQATLAQVLADLAALRRVRAALEALPPVRPDQIAAYWPELGSLFGPARRSGGAVRSRPREAAAESESASVLEAPPPEMAPEPETPDQAPASSAAQPTESQEATPKLAPLLVEALSSQGRALNTTQMLGWLHERGVQATREQITDTLFRHEDMFRRRGTSLWVPAGRE
jgi:hypothetical protein